MSTQHTFNCIEHLMKMYTNSILVEQNLAIRQELEKEALEAIKKKCERKLTVLENETP